MKTFENILNTLRLKNKAMRSYSKLTLVGLSLSAAMITSSCVNEWPHPEDLTYDVHLLVHCETDWLPEYDMTYTRDNSDLDIIYQFKIYPKGNNTTPVQEFSIYKDDFTRADFTVDVTLNPGSYDVYVWSDVCNANTGKSLYYDSSDFSAITYLRPYQANSNNKDAFRGMTSFTIDDPMELHPSSTEKIIMKRPLSRYIFVATDLDVFIENEVSRGKIRSVDTRDGSYDINSRDLEEELNNYTIKVIYPLYMPSVFDIFTDKPYDSWTGMSFNANISPITETTAAIGLDYVMIGLDPSSVQLALEIYDNEGVLIGGTQTINVPILRDRTTVIYGEFLTSQEDTGITINPDFDGQFNIHL